MLYFIWHSCGRAAPEHPRMVRTESKFVSLQGRQEAWSAPISTDSFLCVAKRIWLESSEKYGYMGECHICHFTFFFPEASDSLNLNGISGFSHEGDFYQKKITHAYTGKISHKLAQLRPYLWSTPPEWMEPCYITGETLSGEADWTPRYPCSQNWEPYHKLKKESVQEWKSATYWWRLSTAAPHAWSRLHRLCHIAHFLSSSPRLPSRALSAGQQ